MDGLAATDDGLMRIAVPLFGDRVSPHFGASSRFLLIVADAGEMVGRETLDSGLKGGWQLARHLLALKVNKLVCGGIQRHHKHWLQRNGIRVVDNQRGPVEALVTALIVSSSTDKR